MNTNKKIKAMTLGVALTFMVSVLLIIFCAVISASSASVFLIYDVPDEVIEGKVEYLDLSFTQSNTDAVITINSDSTASLENADEIGYYVITFTDEHAYIGSASFYLGESGNIYSYSFTDTENNVVYERIDKICYESYDLYHYFDFNTGVSVIVNDVPSNATTADIYYTNENGDYGEIQLLSLLEMIIHVCCQI
ncbi:MAG: hypothetical protein LUG26_08955 [Ruminococcus sp.]|nr:hypothetical protein [Ruminococcus sp.]